MLRLATCDGAQDPNSEYDQGQASRFSPASSTHSFTSTTVSTALVPLLKAACLEL